MAAQRGPEDAVFFASPREFYEWLGEHHADTTELWVGFRKVRTGRPPLTWAQAVDQALCFGWIDGVRKGVDGERYAIRFTPRKRGSTWSRVNVDRVAELTEQGLMQPAALAAFAARKAERTAIYSYERHQATFEPDAERRFRENAAAWEFFSAQPPWYRRAATHWIVSAKRPETRERRLATLIADSAAGRRLGQLARVPRR